MRLVQQQFDGRGETLAANRHRVGQRAFHNRAQPAFGHLAAQVIHRARAVQIEEVDPALAAAEVDVYLVDTGFNGARLLGPAEMATAAGAAAHEVVRLQTVAEQLGEVTAEGFATAYEERLALATARAVVVTKLLAEKGE